MKTSTSDIIFIFDEPPQKVQIKINKNMIRMIMFLIVCLDALVLYVHLYNTYASKLIDLLKAAW